jgi:AhpD family alkylhydroperoxidase
MATHGKLSERQQELVAIGAAIAAGCRPCTRFHVRAARAAGATAGDLRRAVDRGLEARRSAADHMARLAERLLAGVTEGEPAQAGLAIDDDLVSAAAALAANCGIDLAGHAARAREHGASGGQIDAALGIARMVKTMAENRAEAAARRIAATADDCGQQPRALNCACGETGVPA